MKARQVWTCFFAIMLVVLVASAGMCQGYRSAWSLGATAEYGFYGPQGVAVDSVGNIYVADYSGNCVQKLSPSGTFLAKLGNVGEGQLAQPGGVAVDSTGSVYVADSGRNRIGKFSATGVFLGWWGKGNLTTGWHAAGSGETPAVGSGDGQFKSPQGVAIDSSGHVYVADTGNYRIQEISPSGALLAKWGSSGTGDGQLSGPYSVAVDSAGNVYVAESVNNRIQKFSSSGTFVAKWGSKGSGDGQFNAPRGVAVDLSGNVYVADTNNNRIQEFNSSGAFVAKWGITGHGDGQFYSPYGVALDSSGNVYVADTNQGVVQKFNSAGAFLAKWGGGASGDGQLYYPYGVALDSSGNVYVADCWNYRVQKFDPSGALLTQWGSDGTGDGQFKGPYGIAMDSSGNVYVMDTWNYRVQKFDSSGRFLTKWGSEGTGPGQFREAYGIAVDSSGNVYVGDYHNFRIQKFTSSGDFLAAFGDYNVFGYYGPYGVAVDSSGIVYATNTAYNCISRFGPTGESLSPLSLGTAPYSVCVDSVGNVYAWASAGSGGGIYKLSPSGDLLAKVGSQGTGDGHVDVAWGLAVDTAGNVYAADSNNHRVQKFTPCPSLAGTWSLAVGSSLGGASALGNRVFVGSEDGKVRCEDAAAGTQVWTFDARTNGAGSTAAIRCRPAVYGPLGAERIYFSTTDGHLFCISNTGALIWQQAAQVVPDSTPAAVAGKVYVGGYDGVLAFADSDGSPAGSSPSLGAIVRSSPSIPNGSLIWVGCENGQLFGLSPDLTIRTQQQASTNPVIAPPLVDTQSQRLFVGTTGQSFNCVDATTFAPIWSVPVDGGVSTAAWPDGGKLYFGSSLGTLYCVSAVNGALQWKFDAAGPILSSPVVYNGWAYFGTESGFVYAVNTANRSDVAVYESSSGSFTSSPCICNTGGANVMVIAGMNGTVYGFPLK